MSNRSFANEPQLSFVAFAPERDHGCNDQRDALAAARRELPRVKVEKRYVFEEPSGKRKAEAGCRGCSFVADNIEGG